MSQTILLSDEARRLLEWMSEAEGVTLSELVTRALCSHQAVNHGYLWDRFTAEQQVNLFPHYYQHNVSSDTAS